MKENAIKKINTMGKVGNVLVIISMIMMGLAIFGCLVGSIVLGVLPEDFVKVKVDGTALVTVDLGAIGQTIPDEAKNQVVSGIGAGNGSFSVEGKVFEFVAATVEDDLIKVVADGGVEEFSIKKFALAPLAAIFTLAATMVVLGFACALSRAFMKCQSPFEEKVIMTMRNLAISMIPWVVVDMIVEAVIQMVTKSNANFNLSVDFSQVFTVLIVFALTFVFKYGAMLQQESDETL